MVAIPSLVAVIGNPNTGKSTLFNALTGLRQKTANFPGVTVEKRTGSLLADGRELVLVDLPGTYTLTAHSLDELVAVDVVLGKAPGLPAPAGILVAVDATNLYRNLFLVHQVRELGIPLVIALTMVDIAERKGISIDLQRLSAHLRSPVVPVVAPAGLGLTALQEALVKATAGDAPRVLPALPEVQNEAKRLRETANPAGDPIAIYEIERAIIDGDSPVATRLGDRLGSQFSRQLGETHERMGGRRLAATEARTRYAEIRRIVEEVESRTPPEVGLADRVGAFLNRPLPATLLFLLVMTTVFQAVFAWATPIMELIDAATTWMAGVVTLVLPAGALASLIADGMIAGVGSVVIFLPQILMRIPLKSATHSSGRLPPSPG